ncbi:39S ribosomal protein L44, mitochondrial [Gryllus bimaculatus]|nr:39S ribosomal protein L44, mitochondrial [Gryllus bimaculatus]
MSALRLVIQSTICGTNVIRCHEIFTARGIKRWVAPTLKELERRRKKLGPQPPPLRSSFVEWNYKAEWYSFGKRLHEEFNEHTLQRAFTHRSYIVKEEESQKEAGIENPELNLEDNQKLIVEGTNFMKKYIRNYVSLLLPKFPEEGIRAVCNYLLEDKMLAFISENIGTKDLILSSDVPPEEETLASTLKAVVGALIESSGEEKAGLFVRDFIVTQLVEKDVNDIWHPEDPFTTLTDIMRRDGREIPEPRLINETGRNTILSTYEVGVYSDKQFLGSGSGETIEVAKQLAAHNALRRLFKTTENMLPFSFKMNPYGEHVKPSIEHCSISEWKSKNVNC